MRSVLATMGSVRPRTSSQPWRHWRHWRSQPCPSTPSIPAAGLQTPAESRRARAWGRGEPLLHWDRWFACVTTLCHSAPQLVFSSVLRPSPPSQRVLQFGAALGGQPAAAAVADGVEAAGGEAEDAGQLAGDAEQQQEQWGEPGEQDQWDGPGEPQRPGQQPGAWDEPEEPADWEHFAPPQAGGGDAAAAEADAAAYEEAPGGMWDGADGGHADFGLGLEEDGEEAEGYEAEGYGAAEEAGAWFPGFQTPVGEEEAGTPDMPVRRMLQLEGAAEPAGGEWQGGAAQRAAGKELGEHIPMAGAPQSPQSPAAGQLERNGGYEEVGWRQARHE